MLGLKLQLSDRLETSGNTTFVFKTRTELSPRQNCCGAWPPGCPQGTWHLPCCQWGGTPGSTRLHLLTPPPQATSREEGRESTAEGTVAERGTNREFEMLKRWGGIIRFLSPQQGFPLFPRTCSHCFSGVTTPAMGTSTLQLGKNLFLLHGNMLPSLPWLSANPTSFWKPETGIS